MIKALTILYLLGAICFSLASQTGGLSTLSLQQARIPNQNYQIQTQSWPSTYLTQNGNLRVKGQQYRLQESENEIADGETPEATPAVEEEKNLPTQPPTATLPPQPTSPAVPATQAPLIKKPVINPLPFGYSNIPTANHPPGIPVNQYSGVQVSGYQKEQTGQVPINQHQQVFYAGGSNSIPMMIYSDSATPPITMFYLGQGDKQIQGAIPNLQPLSLQMNSQGLTPLNLPFNFFDAPPPSPVNPWDRYPIFETYSQQPYYPTDNNKYDPPNRPVQNTNGRIVYSKPLKPKAADIFVTNLSSYPLSRSAITFDPSLVNSQYAPMFMTSESQRLSNMRSVITPFWGKSTSYAFNEPMARASSSDIEVALLGSKYSNLPTSPYTSESKSSDSKHKGYGSGHGSGGQSHGSQSYVSEHGSSGYGSDQPYGRGQSHGSNGQSYSPSPSGGSYSSSGSGYSLYSTKGGHHSPSQHSGSQHSSSNVYSYPSGQISSSHGSSGHGSSSNESPGHGISGHKPTSSYSSGSYGSRSAILGFPRFNSGIPSASSYSSNGGQYGSANQGSHLQSQGGVGSQSAYNHDNKGISFSHQLPGGGHVSSSSTSQKGFNGASQGQSSLNNNNQNYQNQHSANQGTSNYISPSLNTMVLGGHMSSVIPGRHLNTVVPGAYLNARVGGYSGRIEGPVILRSSKQQSFLPHQSATYGNLNAQQYDKPPAPVIALIPVMTPDQEQKIEHNKNQYYTGFIPGGPPQTSGTTGPRYTSRSAILGLPYGLNGFGIGGSGDYSHSGLNNQYSNIHNGHIAGQSSGATNNQQYGHDQVNTGFVQPLPGGGSLFTSVNSDKGFSGNNYGQGSQSVGVHDQNYNAGGLNNQQGYQAVNGLGIGGYGTGTGIGYPARIGGLNTGLNTGVGLNTGIGVSGVGVNGVGLGVGGAGLGLPGTYIR